MLSVTVDGSAAGQARFVVVRDYPPADVEQSWRKFVQNADFPTHYATPEYFREPFFHSKKPFAVLSIAAGEVAAICTGIRVGRSAKCGLWGRPQVAMSRSVHPEAAVAGLAAGLREESRSCDLIDVFAWKKLPGMAGWGFRERQDEGTVVLDLSLGPDVLFSKFTRTRRQDIRTAIKAGVTVNLAASSKDIAAFYDLYCEWAAQKGLPVESWEVMEAALSLSNRRLFLARHQQKVIASLIVRYVPDGIMEASGSCSYKESLSRSLGLHPNDLLHLRAIEWGCSQRLKSYSLGGTHLFLRKFGGPVLPNYRYRRDRTLLRTHTIRDIASELARIGAAHAPAPLVTLGRRFRDRVLH